MIDSTQKARILVVEDHSFVRQGMVAFLNRQNDLTCCGEADSVASTPAVVEKEKPDLVLLDLQLKDGEAFELINSLKLQFPELRILVVSQCDETLYAERVLQAGAKGYIMKQEAPQELLGAIRVVLEGQVYLSPAMTARLLHAPFMSPGIDPQKQRNRNG